MPFGCLPSAFEAERHRSSLAWGPELAIEAQRPARLDSVSLGTRGEVIYEIDKPIRYVYFPLRAFSPL